MVIFGFIVSIPFGFHNIPVHPIFIDFSFCQKRSCLCATRIILVICVVTMQIFNPGLWWKLTLLSLATFSSTVSPLSPPDIPRKAPKKHGAKHTCGCTKTWLDQRAPTVTVHLQMTYKCTWSIKFSVHNKYHYTANPA